MPEQTTLKRARAAKRAGRAPSTQAGEFVREEMDHIREGKHGARSTKQAIAIGLSKARKAGVNLPAPKKGTTSERTRRAAKRALSQGRQPHKRRLRRVRARRSKRSSARAMRLRRRSALARQARSSARKRSASSRRASARQAARTKGPALRRSAARKAAATRRRRAEPDKGPSRRPGFEFGTGRAHRSSRAGTQALVLRGDRLLGGVHPARDLSVARIRSNRPLASRRLDSVRLASGSGDRRRGEPRAVRPARRVDRASRPAAGPRPNGGRCVCVLALWRMGPDLQPVSISVDGRPGSQRARRANWRIRGGY